ncbi:hypothetical protein WJX84_001166 [Apatococcus fuscideae]|uniref:Acetyltransferase component of pyruvate dehydrogenase complex n=1 Tax=Apatococcus fuscideae TaxID=2026836 RepID=A0AAW1T481_9CHLO
MGAARRLAPQICRSFRRGFSGMASSGGSSSAQDRLLASACIGCLSRTAARATAHLANLGPVGGAMMEPQLPMIMRCVTTRRGVSSCRGFASLPPHTELQMPSLSPTMNQGNIAGWKKQPGDEIAAGDVLCEVETDKATMEWEAQDEGFMAKILVDAGAKDIAVGTPVAVVCEDAGDVGAFENYQPGEGAPAAAAAEESEEPEAEDAPGVDGVESESGATAGDFPEHVVLGLPALSPTMSQGNIAGWKKKEGEAVAAGDSIAEIETDKATMEWEAQDDGFVAKILLEAGAKDIPVGEPALVIVEEEGDVAAFSNFSKTDASGGEPKKPAPKKEAAPSLPPAEPKQKEQPEQAPPKPQPATSKPAGTRVVASPYAKKLAREANVDVSQAQASGPNGRIVAADVQQLIQSGGGQPAQAAPEAASQATAEAPEGGEFTDEQHSQIRKVTAKRLLESKQTIPHYYLTIDCRVDRLLSLRKQLNEQLAAGSSGAKLSVNDFVVKAAALALKKVPDVNAAWYPDFTRRFHNIDISIAVQTPVGLMVPILRNADGRGLTDISAGIKALAGKAKDNKLKPDEFTGGTFTVSNLGMFGVDQFSAIINPPQSAILAVGGSSERVVPTASGSFEAAMYMSATLSCDHRVVDGAMGATWLQAFRGYLEDPVTMIL